MSRAKMPETREIFCIAYVDCLSVPTAALKAGISERSGWDWMHEVGVQDRIAELAKLKFAAATDVSAIEVLSELVRIALADPMDAFNANGSMKPLHEIPASLRRTISGMKVQETWNGLRGEEREQTGEIKELKFWDKTRGLEMLARHLALFKDTLTINDGRVEADDAMIAARAASIIDGIWRRVHETRAIDVTPLQIEYDDDLL